MAAAALLATAARSASAPPALLAQTAPVLDRAALLDDVQRALDAGAPFHASRLLAPLLAEPAEPGIVLLAARAAHGWEGWGTLVRLLSGAPWLDALSAGEGRALLARARVERGDAAAVADARRAVLAAGTRAELLGPRLVTLARAYDRAEQLDSAAAVYLRAERLLPGVAEWLRLRAAGVLRDTATRSRLYRSLVQPAVSGRIRWTEALARDRAGDWRGASRLYSELGAPLTAIRIRLRAAATPVARGAERRELIALLAGRLGSDDTRDAIALLDAAFPSLTAEEELVVARRAAASDPTRAVRGFRRASSVKALDEADRLSYGSALARSGRHDEARGVLASITRPELRDQAEYQRARSLLTSGFRSEAIAALQRQSQAPSGDSATAATAGYLSADLLVDAGDEAGARRAYRDVAVRFPRTSHGARAALQAALLAWVHGERDSAAVEFAALADRATETPEGIAALYWSGRASWAAGDTLGAKLRWQRILERHPGSYYSVPAAERLGVAPFRPPPPMAMAQPDSTIQATLDRAALLERLGLRVEAGFEYARLSRYAESAGLTLALARAHAERGNVGRAFRLAGRYGESAPEQLGFPLPARHVLEEARRTGADPLLAAALIRQESGFDPQARSSADARGLMQVLPRVGAGLAPRAGLHEWDPALLYQPELNAHFGMLHLVQVVGRYPRLAPALAAYNAGERPANRWLALPGAGDDPDLFIERIQYLETRDYVRRVLRNYAVYRALYPSLP